MFLIRPLHKELYLFTKLFIMPHELPCLWGDPGPPSGDPTCLPLEELKTKPFFQGSDETPCFAIGHPHLLCRPEERVRPFDPFQKLEGTISKNLSVLIKPDLVNDLHARNQIVILK